MIRRFFIQLITVWCTIFDLRNSRQTQDELNSIYDREGHGRSGQWCNKDSSSSDDDQEAPKEENTFLDMANFLEYVQLTDIRENSREDAIKFFNVSTAAFEFGSNLVAQESFGRAVNALQKYRSRTKRDAVEQTPRDVIDIWDPADLFTEFRRTMGTHSFNQLLHLKKKVGLETLFFQNFDLSVNEPKSGVTLYWHTC